MFDVQWAHTCYRCAAPMNVSLIIRDPDIDTFFRDYGSWAAMRPFTLDLNTHYYKFFGGPRVRRVCITCFFNPETINLIDRECGVTRTKIRCERSKTVEEIIEYFQKFSDFRKRKDIELYIVDEHKRISNLGIQLDWIPL